METDVIIIVCACVWMAAAAACMFGRSRMIQRVGAMELMLAAAVGGSAVFGYLKAADFTKGQYHQMLAIMLGSADPYLADLEDEMEVYGGSEEAFLRQAESIVEDALPILQSVEARAAFDKIFLVEKDEQGVYHECFSAGSLDWNWESLRMMADPLIGRAVRGRETVWQECEGEETVFAAADKLRIAPSYALVTVVSRKPLMEALGALKTQYFCYSLFFMTAATLCVILLVLIQEKDMHRTLRLLKRVAEGREEVSAFLRPVRNSPFQRQSNESRALYSVLQQIAVNSERMDYRKLQVLQAYHRFAPKEVEKILGRQSILDVAPMDRVETESTVVFVSFAERDGGSGGEYLQQMNRNYALLFEEHREFGGSILSGGSYPGVILLLFYDESRRALQFGIRMSARAMADQTAGQAFVFLHRTPLVYGVAGDEEQSFPYIYSEEIRILQKYTDHLRAMGVRMAVTEYVWELEKDEVQSRYIGYIEEEAYRFKLYEILDAHPAEERYRRLASAARFQEALDLYYKSDFYLARSVFSDILRSCPGDEVARWYLFLCENGLNGEKSKGQSFGLFSGK